MDVNEFHLQAAADELDAEERKRAETVAHLRALRGR